MKHITVSYVYYFNKKYKRVGYLFRYIQSCYITQAAEGFAVTAKKAQKKLDYKVERYEH